MPTNWTLPTTIEQYVEPGGDPGTELSHISWSRLDALKTDNDGAQSNGYIFHIACQPKHDLKNKTYFIRATGFKFKNPPDVVSGVEFRLTARRYGRVTDDTIQLCVVGRLMGDNKATLLINPQKVYGGEADLWNARGLDALVLHPTFGITIRFKAHPNAPHRDPALVNALEMRLY